MLCTRTSSAIRSSHSMPVPYRRVVEYFAAVLWALAGLAVTSLSLKVLAGPFFMFQFAAIVGAALYGGLGPGLLATLVSSIGFCLAFFPPTFRGPEGYRLSSLLLLSLVFVFLASRLRTAKAVETSARVRLAIEKAEAEAALAKAEAAENEAKSIGAQQERLVAMVSHDLRSPINAIIMTAQRLQRHGDDAERQAKGLSLIVTSARRMQSMIGDLLDYAVARHGAGLPVQLKPERLGEVCRTAIAEVRTAQPSRVGLRSRASTRSPIWRVGSLAGSAHEMQTCLSPRQTENGMSRSASQRAWRAWSRLRKDLLLRDKRRRSG